MYSEARYGVLMTQIINGLAASVNRELGDAAVRCLAHHGFLLAITNHSWLEKMRIASAC
jgi:hypothetical protein